ncbi:MAG: FkbM family methyltransferase [Ekhidna sp.]
MLQLIYKTIYHPSINYLLRNLNKALFPRFFKIPPSGKMKVEIGGFSFTFHMNQTSYLAKLIFWNGPENFEYSDLFVSLAKKTKRFLDIGSNIGYYSIIAAKSNPHIDVISFEPAAGPLHYLKKNININKIDQNVKIESYAIADHEGTIEFHVVYNTKYRFLKHNLAGEGNAGSKLDPSRFTPIQVEAMTLDHYCNINSVDRIDLIKLDTEGTEVDILLNAKDTIERNQPIVICETLFNTIEDKLEEVMLSHNYLFFNHTSKGLKQVKSIKRDEDDGIRNCFFVPKSKVDLIQEYVFE